ncbi:hypothetical protein Tco_0588856, partial [Tanacetum coccineum]
EEDEVQKVRPSRPTGTEQAKKKEKAGASSASSTTGFVVESLAKLMVKEYATVKESYNVQKGQNMTELLHMKKMELKLKAAELEIRRMDQRKKALYMSTNDEELKAVLRTR